MFHNEVLINEEIKNLIDMIGLSTVKRLKELKTGQCLASNYVDELLKTLDSICIEIFKFVEKRPHVLRETVFNYHFWLVSQYFKNIYEYFPQSFTEVDGYRIHNAKKNFHHTWFTIKINYAKQKQLQMSNAKKEVKRKLQVEAKQEKIDEVTEFLNSKPTYHVILAKLIEAYQNRKWSFYSAVFQQTNLSEKFLIGQLNEKPETKEILFFILLCHFKKKISMEKYKFVNKILSYVFAYPVTVKEKNLILLVMNEQKVLSLHALCKMLEIAWKKRNRLQFTVSQYIYDSITSLSGPKEKEESKLPIESKPENLSGAINSAQLILQSSLTEILACNTLLNDLLRIRPKEANSYYERLKMCEEKQTRFIRDINGPAVDKNILTHINKHIEEVMNLHDELNKIVSIAMMNHEASRKKILRKVDEAKDKSKVTRGHVIEAESPIHITTEKNSIEHSRLIHMKPIEYSPKLLSHDLKQLSKSKRLIDLKFLRDTVLIELNRLPLLGGRFSRIKNLFSSLPKQLRLQQFESYRSLDKEVTALTHEYVNSRTQYRLLFEKSKQVNEWGEGEIKKYEIEIQWHRSLMHHLNEKLKKTENKLAVIRKMTLPFQPKGFPTGAFFNTNFVQLKNDETLEDKVSFDENLIKNIINMALD